MDNENITSSPNKRDIQLFHKRLRLHFNTIQTVPRSLKYFLVSEYGYETERLHYHAIYFNLPYEPKTTYIQIANELSRVWQKGIVYVKSFDTKQIGYCLKYLHKDKELGNIQLSSKNLGEISQAYIRYMNTTSNMENLKVRNANGKMVNLPRYFRKKFLTDEQKEQFTEYFVRKNEKETADVQVRKTIRLNFERENYKFSKNVKR